MIFLDFEVFRYNWLLVWTDTKTRKTYVIVDDKEKLEGFYKHYKNEVMIGYNINHYDKYVLQAILCDFDPFEVSKHIIVDGKQGWEYSRLMNKFPVITYDTMVKEKSLKQLECSMGLKIKESSVDFMIDRPLTKEEIKESIEYCKHDVFALIELFMQNGFYMSPQERWQSALDIIDEFGFPKSYLSKTEAQLGCSVLGAVRKDFNDEFDIMTPNLPLGKYEYVRDWFLNKENHWYNRKVEGRKQPIKNEFVTTIAGIEHVFAWGGVHASCKAGIYDGILLMCDFASLYPNIMIEYDLVSRGVANPEKYKELLRKRIELKTQGIGREKVYKIVLNGSYGQMKFFGGLYDPRNANNVCVHGQIIALYLLSKLEKVGQILNTNTDGILVKVNTLKEKELVEQICKEVAEEVRIGIDVDEFKRFIVKDVNNYIAIKPNGKYKAKGSYVKELTPLEQSMSIVNKAIRDYYLYGTLPEITIGNCNNILEFQIIAKVGSKYSHAIKDIKFLETKEINPKTGRYRKVVKQISNGYVLPEKVNRVFASKCDSDGGIYKVHKATSSVGKVEMTPEHCFIINEDVREMSLPTKLDKSWYINIAKKRIAEFIKN